MLFCIVTVFNGTFKKTERKEIRLVVLLYPSLLLVDTVGGVLNFWPGKYLVPEGGL